MILEHHVDFEGDSRKSRCTRNSLVLETSANNSFVPKSDSQSQTWGGIPWIVAFGPKVSSNYFVHKEFIGNVSLQLFSTWVDVFGSVVTWYGNKPRAEKSELLRGPLVPKRQNAKLPLL